MATYMLISSRDFSNENWNDLKRYFKEAINNHSVLKDFEKVKVEVIYKKYRKKKSKPK